VAVVKPFRALRYDERRVGPLGPLLAPPYDVISPEERARFLEASPVNVVHLTLPDDEQGAARLLAEWRREGDLVQDAEPALWWLAQDFTGPDGIARRRDGLVAALRLEAYAAGVIRPHERTHAGPKEGRLRLLRATRTQLEPLLFLYEGTLPSLPGEPVADVEAEGVRNRLWRVEGPPPPQLAGAALLIADGHHRYETALAFHEEDGTEASAWLLAVIVPTEQEGLTIFPTHRIALRTRPLPRLAPAPANGRAAAEVYTRAGSGYLVGEERELDAELVARYADEVRYTPYVEEARAAVDAGEAEAAFLLRPPTVEQVAAVAGAGRTMPQKSTYFYPKVASGLLFLPLE
jgi:uncharacterized protein (DUF1015 family)